MKKIYIDYKRENHKTLAALVNDGHLEELIIEDEKSSQIGDIYVGKILAIQTGFVFLDIGLEKSAFLSANDNKERSLYNKNGKLQIKQGDDLIVQVLKNPSGSKGATVTTQISCSSKYILIYEGVSKSIGISKKIESLKERRRLKKIAADNLPENIEIIVRTMCENKSEEEFLFELQKLQTELRYIKDNGQYIKAPALIHRKTKTVSDLYSDDLDSITVNDAAMIVNIQKELEEIHPIKPVTINIYDGQIPLFKEYLIESQIDKALQRQVWLKSGAFLIFEQTEACFVIDVNTGKYTAKKSYTDMVYKTNMEAAVEIARQIRLRNLSGIIIIDFIDMQAEEQRKNLHTLFEAELKKDRIPSNVTEMNILGLVVITRKKTRNTISKDLTIECEVCKGTGRIKI